MQNWHQSHQEAHQPHQKKRFSEEETLERVEQRLDANMDRIMNTWFVHKFLTNKIVKNVLNAHFVWFINEKLQPYLKIIFTVVGRISLITWIIGIFSFLISLSGIGFMFSLWVVLGIRVLIYLLLSIAFSLLSLFVGIGLVKFKKRVIGLAILGFGVSLVSCLISLIPVGLYSFKSYGSFGGSFFNLLITFVLLVLIIKNEHMFKN